MKVPLTALFQVACPYCERDYLLELDLVKLARLKRIAICGQCSNQFSVSVRTQRSQAAASHARGAAAIEEGATPAEDAAAAHDFGRERARRQHFESMQTEPSLHSPAFAEEAGAEARDEGWIRVDSDTSGQQRTLGGVGAPARGPATTPVDTHIIVEVGTLDTGAQQPRKHLKTYRPHNLVTKPGLGIPFQLRAAAAGESVSRAEE